MKYAAIVFSFLLGLAVLPAAWASSDVGEGYAKPTFKELTQTIVLLGGLDINDKRVSDEYIRLVYCDSYRKNFKDDVAWGALKKQVLAHVMEKKEYFRVFYETTGVFKLGRYDAEKKVFPLTPDTVMKNVGSLILFKETDFKPYCDMINKKQTFFSPDINLTLNHPLTLDKFSFPPDDVEKLMARMTEAKNTDRLIYGRIRFRITEAPSTTVYDQMRRADLKGDVMALDFFLDSDLTKPVASVAIPKL